MSHMSDISIQIQNLEADVDALKGRVLEERGIADYWFERCLKAEAKLHDEVNYRPASRTSTGYPTTD